MIRYSLICACEAAFEAWFQSSAAYERLESGGMLECPECGGGSVRRQIMAPAVARSGEPATPDPAQAMAAFAAKARQHVARNFDYVGDKFADVARAMNDGRQEARAIWGQTTPDDARALQEEGVPALPLPEPFVPPIPRGEDEVH